MTPPPVKTAASGHRLRLLQPADPNDRRFLEQVRSLKPEAAVVVSYGQMLSRALLDLFPRGAFNLHASLLPKYRGAAPIPWALAQGEKETGVTIFQLDEQLDHGPILLQARQPIRAEDDGLTLSKTLSDLGSRTLLKAFDLLKAGRGTLIPQDHSKATSAPRLTKEDGQIRWEQSCLEIHNRVRAFQPWPGAFTHWEGKLLKLIHTHSDPDRLSEQPAGAVVAADPRQGLWVQTGRGQLRIDRCQLAAGKILSAADFLRGHPLPPGALLR